MTPPDLLNLRSAGEQGEGGQGGGDEGQGDGGDGQEEEPDEDDAAPGGNVTCGLGSGRIVVSEKEVLILLVNMV